MAGNPSPGVLNLEVYSGDTLSLPLVFDDGTNPLVLTGYTFAAQARLKKADTTATAVFTFDTTDAATGEIILQLSALESAKLTKASYSWDLQWTDPDDNVLTVLAGTIAVTLDVTR